MQAGRPVEQMARSTNATSGCDSSGRRAIASPRRHRRAHDDRDPRPRASISSCIRSSASSSTIRTRRGSLIEQAFDIGGRGTTCGSGSRDLRRSCRGRPAARVTSACSCRAMRAGRADVAEAGLAAGASRHADPSSDRRRQRGRPAPHLDRQAARAARRERVLERVHHQLVQHQRDRRRLLRRHAGRCQIERQVDVVATGSP